jgi:hypothetical protein
VTPARTYWVLTNPTTGRLIDIDESSGGYPYDVDSPARAHFFPNRDEAEGYKKHFPLLVIQQAIIVVTNPERTS